MRCAEGNGREVGGAGSSEGVKDCVAVPPCHWKDSEQHSAAGGDLELTVSSTCACYVYDTVRICRRRSLSRSVIPSAQGRWSAACSHDMLTGGLRERRTRTRG